MLHQAVGHHIDEQDGDHEDGGGAKNSRKRSHQCSPSLAGVGLGPSPSMGKLRSDCYMTGTVAVNPRGQLLERASSIAFVGEDGRELRESRIAGSRVVAGRAIRW